MTMTVRHALILVEHGGLSGATVGKNETLEAVGVSMNENNDCIVVEFSGRGSRLATIPIRGGTTRFPQRLAEEMPCEPLNAD